MHAALTHHPHLHDAPVDPGYMEQPPVPSSLHNYCLKDKVVVLETL